MRPTLARLLLAAFGFASTALAQTQTIFVPLNFPTIQTAINTVPVGGTATIIVLPGIYVEELTILAKNVTLLAPGGPTQTTLSALGLSSLSSTINIDLGATVTVRDFTIQDGTASQGGAVRIHGGSTAMLSGNVFVYNNSPAGGAVYCGGTGVTATVQSNFFTLNNLAPMSSNGGAIMIEGDPTAVPGHSIQILGNTFTGNRAQGTAVTGLGGAVLVRNTAGQSISLTTNVLNNNVAGSFGGAVACQNAQIKLLSNSFGGNRAGDSGGAVSCQSADATVSSNSIKNNFASVQGGGIFADNSSATVTDNEISGNGLPPSGVVLPTEFGGGIYLGQTTATPALVRQNQIHDNVATCGAGIYGYFSNAVIERNLIETNGANLGGNFWPIDGGGVYVDGGAARLQDNVVRGNKALDAGAGLLVRGGLGCRVLQNLIARNEVLDGVGGGIFFSAYGSNTTIEFVGNTIAYNIAHRVGAVGGLGKGGSFFAGSNAGGVQLWNCILWGSTARNEVDGAPVVLQHCDIPATSGGSWSDPSATCVVVDPRFVDPSLDDFHLRASSRARGRGALSPPGGLLPFDLDGNPRVVNGVVDIGAYQFQ